MGNSNLNYRLIGLVGIILLIFVLGIILNNRSNLIDPFENNEGVLAQYPQDLECDNKEDYLFFQTEESDEPYILFWSNTESPVNLEELRQRGSDLDIGSTARVRIGYFQESSCDSNDCRCTFEGMYVNTIGGEDATYL